MSLSAVALSTLFLATAGAANAEECVTGARAMVSWATQSNIPTLAPTYGAATMVTSATKNGYRVDNNPAGCSDSKPCLLIYPKTYGNSINTTYGHVAVLYSKTSNNRYNIADSNGICGGDRKRCTTSPNFSKALVIHPKN
ncbi:hypothetical protein [Pseudanabaena biceps]|nr:hypothetical protein [Pseudanabaena biceps]ELS31211.1 hypothetical protein Pse7429DRAFT_3489 [Pseudanabaena biceps PCC 7429]